MKEWIVGRNPVYETMRAGRRHAFRVVIAEGAQEKGRLAEIRQLAAARKIPVERVARQRLDGLGDGHQGAALEVNDYPYSTLADMLALAARRGEPPFLLLLDALQDPQNLGTLLRTAEITGVHGVLLPFRQTATITPAVVSASSGASEHLLVAQANLAQSIAGGNRGVQAELSEGRSMLLQIKGKFVLLLDGATATRAEQLSDAAWQDLDVETESTLLFFESA
jgi:23S rRNA (guanosine2251-2'-O)-methyltransferase